MRPKIPIRPTGPTCAFIPTRVFIPTLKKAQVHFLLLLSVAENEISHFIPLQVCDLVTVLAHVYFSKQTTETL